MTDYVDFVDQLRNFVKQICRNRSSDHGYEHMNTVYELSLENYNSVYSIHSAKNLEKYKTLAAVALLHDVIDYKFLDREPDVLINTIRLLEKIYPDKAQRILDLIKSVSFSNEKKLRDNGKIHSDPQSIETRNYWINQFGPDDAEILFTVSDSDKLQALGTIGLNRCIAYTKQHFLEVTGNQISKEELQREVKKHANEKLLKLRDYFRTPYGRTQMEPLYQEFCQKLSLFIGEN